MTDTRFPTLARAITAMTPHERKVIARALDETAQPVLHALAIELTRANLDEAQALAEMEVHLHTQEADELGSAAAAELRRATAHAEPQDDFLDLEAAAERYRAAEAHRQEALGRVTQLAEARAALDRLANSGNDTPPAA